MICSERHAKGAHTKIAVARFRIRRFYFKGGSRLVRNMSGLTEAQAQAHCSDKETSSSTCTQPAGRRRTKLRGQWFDGYESY